MIIWSVVSAVLLVAMASGLTFYRPFAAKSVANSQLFNDDPALPPAPLPGKRQTFLVLGVDQRPDDVGRSDSMIVVSYDPKDKQLAMLSLQRDTWVKIPGKGYDKLNHSFAYGGERLSQETVQRFLDIPIDHTVVINFEGFQKIVDALGGVDIDAEKSMYYYDPTDKSMGPKGLLIDIQAGPQHMDGLTTLKYSRFRHDAESDWGRMRRQQQVTRALMQGAAKPSVIGKAPSLISALYSTVTTDMSLGEMLKLAFSAKDVIGEPPRTGITSGEGNMIDGASVQIPNILQVRTDAYQLLVGEEPPTDYLARAREDQAVFDKAVAEGTKPPYRPSPTPKPPTDEKPKPNPDPGTPPVTPCPPSGSPSGTGGTTPSTGSTQTGSAAPGPSGQNCPPPPPTPNPPTPGPPAPPTPGPPAPPTPGPPAPPTPGPPAPPTPSPPAPPTPIPPQPPTPNP